MGPVKAWPWLLLLVASVLARLPAFLNARGVHSDAAIVGLQAMHLLEGEWSPFLWGAGYQASFDAVLIALGFAVTGPSALTLMAVPFLGHLILTGLAFDLLRRELPLRAALFACLPLVFAPQAINGVALYAPRQWSLTAAVLCVWWSGRSVGRSRAWALLAASGFFAGFSVYLDLFALQLLPGLAAFALACALSPWRLDRPLAVRSGGLLGGALLGWGLFAWSRAQPMANATKATLSLDRAGQNLELLLDSCLPWLLGSKVFVPGESLYPGLWVPPMAFQLVQWAGLAVLVAALLWAAVASVTRFTPLPVRRLGALGIAVTLSSIGGFLVSSMPADMWSARYLAPIVWFLPFTLAPAAWRLGQVRFAALLTPYLVTAAVAGWLVFGPWVKGPWPRRDDRGVAEEEARVGEVLRARGVTHAAAQYWLSYRLGFLWERRPVVVPLSEAEDRYPPYREGFHRARRVAYIFHPSEPRAHPAQVEPQLRHAGIPYERLDVDGFTLLILSR